MARRRFSSSGWRPPCDRQQLCSKSRRGAVKGAREARPRQQAIHKREHSCALDQSMRVAGDLPRERDKNAVNFFLLLFDQPHQLVVLLDGLERFHIHRLPRRAGPVNHAGHAPLQLRAHGDHETFAANRNQVFLRGAFARQLAQCRAQALLNQSLLALLLATNAVQLRRGIVGERAVGLNLALDRLRERPQTCGQCRRQFPTVPAACRQAARVARARAPATKLRRWRAAPQLCSSAASSAAPVNLRLCG